MTNSKHELQNRWLFIETRLTYLLGKTHQQSIPLFTLWKRVLKGGHLHEEGKDCLDSELKVSVCHNYIEDSEPCFY